MAGVRYSGPRIPSQPAVHGAGVPVPCHPKSWSRIGILFSACFEAAQRIQSSLPTPTPAPEASRPDRGQERLLRDESGDGSKDSLLSKNQASEAAAVGRPAAASSQGMADVASAAGSSASAASSIPSASHTRLPAMARCATASARVVRPPSQRSAVHRRPGIEGHRVAGQHHHDVRIDLVGIEDEFDPR